MNSNSLSFNNNNSLLYLIFFLIGFSWTNYLFISVLIIPLTLIYFLPYITSNITKLQIAVLFLFLYCFVSLMLVSPSSIFDFNFYRRDGNIFISFMPLITLTFINFNFNSYNFVKRFTYVITFFNVLLYAYFLNFGNLFEDSIFYYFGFSSHNAAGGFLAIIVCFSFCMFYFKRNFINFILFIFNFFTLFQTGSRGSYLAVLIGLIFIFLYIKNFYKSILFFIISGIFIHSLVLSWGYDQHHKYWDENDFYAVDTMELDIRNSNNISHRIIKVWPWAVDDFLKSPIIGTGFSTFNDRDVETKEILPGIRLKITKNNIYNSGHAHHSFLNFAAELGIIGLLLLAYMLLQIYKSIVKMPMFEKILCLLSFVVLLLMSLTEHRLVAPSQAFIFFLFFSILVNNKKWSLKN